MCLKSQVALCGLVIDFNGNFMQSRFVTHTQTHIYSHMQTDSAGFGSLIYRLNALHKVLAKPPRRRS